MIHSNKNWLEQQVDEAYEQYRDWPEVDKAVMKRIKNKMKDDHYEGLHRRKH